MNISISYYSSAGGRFKNEDAAAVTESKSGVLAIVADGLGGQGNGDEAAALAIKSFQYEISQSSVSENLMAKAAEKANEEIRKAQNDRKMCSTLAALWLEDSCAYTVHVGDTRIYQFRDNKMLCRTLDHSVSQMAVIMGEIKEDEIRGHKDRNRLIKALGASADLKPKTQRLDVKKGDAFLLCSDGFWELITEEEMLECLYGCMNAGEWLRMMRTRIEQKTISGSDNHTAAAIIIE